VRPKFAIAVDRVFALVLDLLQRIERGETAAPEDERTRIQAAVTRSENEIGQGLEWELAKYALVAWIDEVLIDASWEGCNWWKEHALEWEHFGTNDRATKFFDQARRAASADMKRRDALEVYYIAVVLGFGGIYTHAKPGEAELWARRNDLPPSIDQWLRQTSKSITLGADRPRIDTTPSNPGLDAAPRDGEAMLVTWGLFGAVLLLLTIALLSFNVDSLARFFEL
jgi:type VI secretion system protein ImpK